MGKSNQTLLASEEESKSPVELSEAIDILLDNEPDRRKKEHRTWIEKVNKLMQEYNDWAQAKIFILRK